MAEEAVVVKYTPQQISEHKTYSGDEAKRSVWVSFEGKVYDITKFIGEHPGGEEVLLDNAGVDITRAFLEIGHSDHARKVITKYLVGDLDGPVAAPVSRKKPTVSHSATQEKSSGTSPLMMAVIVIIIAIIAYGVYSSL